tara:strand:- start:524 stop:1297 length:774 start_codon:yes stop_codon:yes gene_type:complete
MSEIRVNKVIDEAGTGSVELTQGAVIPISKNITGSGGINITGGIIANGNITGNVVGNVTGNVTGTASTATAAANAYGLTGTPNVTVGTIGAGNITSSGSVTAATGSFSGNVSVGGTLTYEDVTNQDVIGLSTFRAGIKVLAGGVDIDGGGVDVVGVYKGNVTAVAASAIDCSLGNYFTKTITGSTTFTFSNVPGSCVYSFTMEVTCNGSNSITWPAAVKWPLDTAPTLTDGKTQLFTFITDDGGTRWRANSAVDYTN